jgi:hypothetical protein
MVMVGRCCEWMLWVMGGLLLVAAIFPFAVMLGIPEPYATEWVTAKLVMLPVGAMCLCGAALLAGKARR